MNKKGFFLIVVLSISISGIGQTYKSVFGKDSTKWNITYIIPDAGFTEILIARGDTVINENNYKKLVLNGTDQGFLREDTITGQVWYLSWNKSEYLVMDMSKEKGDTFQLISYNDTLTIKIDSVGELNGKKVLVTDYYLDSYYENEKLKYVEGTGPTNGFFLASNSFSDPSISYLLCCSKDSETDYVTNLFDGNCYVNWTDIEEGGYNNNFSVYPNPMSGTGYLKLDESGIETKLELYSIRGSLIHTTVTNENNIQINSLLFPNGFYFYRIVRGSCAIKTDRIIINNSK